MRKAARIDRNQPEIVRALRGAGAAVETLAAVGKGVPDLLVCFRRVLYLLEVKDGSRPPSRRKLTDDQVEWHRLWPGPIHVVKNVTEALESIGAIK